jgi:long-chain acyl-CoA synthetase
MKKEIWLKHYPAGVPAEVNPDIFPSAVAMIENSFAKFRDLPALHSMGREMTFGQLDELSSQFAAYLQNQTKLQPGDRFAILCPNLLQYPVAMLGVLRAGMILVGTNPLYTPREMEYQLKDSGAKGIMILSNFLPVLEKVLQNTDIEHIIVTEATDELLPPQAQPPIPTYNLPNSTAYRAVKAEAKSLVFKPVAIQGSDIAFLQYTGGTTGFSKGAMITHRNIIANVEQTKAWVSLEMYHYEEGEQTIINAMPLYHAFSLVGIFMNAASQGNKQVLVANPRDFKGFAQELAKHKFTSLSAVNTIYTGLMLEPELEKVDFSQLKFCMSGGMPVQRAMVDKWKSFTQNEILEGYGMSEVTCTATANPVDGSAKLGTAGIPIPSTEIKLMKDDASEAELGERGEIWIKGPQVMAGYWNKPQETAQALENGWMKSGDIGVMNEEGFISIVDRKKDMLIVSGFNVYPNEIEQVTNMLAGVIESACIGVADERAGEVPKIFVVRQTDSLTPEAVIAHCKANLTGYKVPKYVEFIAELPKSNVGKILRRNLREKEVSIKD